MITVEGLGGIKATAVADSVNSNGDRITTFELEYHRFIHGELMTHRLFSRNAMSSRAVPVKKMIEQVRNYPATPIHWGKNQSGMQAQEELTGLELQQAITEWKLASVSAADHAERLCAIGGHKQIVNRLLEPFQMMKVVLTATEFGNFFWLRLDTDAQPEIQELARCMFEVMGQSTPEHLSVGEWHTPYVRHVPHQGGIDYYSEGTSPYDTDISGEKRLDIEQAIAISSSCCAQVSYRSIDASFDKAMSVYERLGVGSNKIHASPFEHIGTPMDYDYLEDVNVENAPWPHGTTHMDRKGDFWSGNFKGWIQHRQLLENHTKW